MPRADCACLSRLQVLSLLQCTVVKLLKQVLGICSVIAVICYEPEEWSMSFSRAVGG